MPMVAMTPSPMPQPPTSNAAQATSELPNTGATRPDAESPRGDSAFASLDSRPYRVSHSSKVPAA